MPHTAATVLFTLNPTTAPIAAAVIVGGCALLAALITGVCHLISAFIGLRRDR